MNFEQLAQDYAGYYSLPFTGEPFEGDVIKIDAVSMNILYQQYSTGDEYSFRQKLERYDEWFYDKPYRVQERWLTYIINWLKRDRDK